MSLIRKSLKNKGYIVANLEKSGRFIKEKDLWNLWDLLAIRGKTHLFIQAKTNLRGQKWKIPYVEFGKSHGSRCVRYEIWVKFDYIKGFDITECKNEAKKN